MMSMHKVKWIFFGFCFILGSLAMWSSGYYREGGPVEPWAVIPAFATGIILTFYGILSPSQGKTIDHGMTICPKCMTPFGKDESAEGVCPECGIPLEPLAGVYDRHPELKTDDRGEDA